MCRVCIAVDNLCIIQIEIITGCYMEMATAPATIMIHRIEKKAHRNSAHSFHWHILLRSMRNMTRTSTIDGQAKQSKAN